MTENFNKKYFKKIMPRNLSTLFLVMRWQTEELKWKRQIGRSREEIRGTFHYLKLNYNDFFTILVKIFFISNWKMNTDSKLAFWGSRREEGKKSCSLIFTIPLISKESPGSVVRLPSVYSMEVLKREMFIKESSS